MKLPVFNQKGKKTTKMVTVSDSVFGDKINPKLLAQYVYVYLSNQRSPIAHTKTRGEVRGGGRKPHRQKGTGRARAGSIRSPIWKGGGITFGPRKERNWKKSITKKMRTKAMTSALSKQNADENIKIIDQIKLQPTKLTKQALEVITSFGSPRKLTLVTAERDDNLVKAFSNIPNSEVIRVGELNAYDVLNAGNLIIMQDSLGYMERWNTGSKETKDVKDDLPAGRQGQGQLKTKEVAKKQKTIKDDLPTNQAGKGQSKTARKEK